MARERERPETLPKVTPKFLCSPGTFLSIVLFPSSEVQLCFKSPTEPAAFFPLAFIDFSWHADVALHTEVLCWGLCQKQEWEPVSATASGPTAWESNSLFIHEWSCCVGNWDILLPMVAGYTPQSNGMGKLWNSFLCDQILLKIRKPNRNQGAQACSSPFSHAYPLCC